MFKTKLFEIKSLLLMCLYRKCGFCNKIGTKLIRLVHIQVSDIFLALKEDHLSLKFISILQKLKDPLIAGVTKIVFDPRRATNCQC